MKYSKPDNKPSRDHESSPARYRMRERPDNGATSSSNLGPSSEAHKDNPHRRLRLARHTGVSG